jgi:2-keto-4-pentenoate hydratase/2-oxohepta-3-ene-1,7-dioic acid hydratase in catechol pathway
MKLLRYGEPTFEKPGILDAEGQIRAVSHYVSDWTPATITPEQLHKLKDIDLTSCPIISDTVRLGPCVANVPNFLCIGLNYKEHVLETGKDLTDEPVLFTKLTSSISGPNDPIIIPHLSIKTDWEVELGIIIGRPAKYVKEENALDYVAGFCLINDVTERAFQMERGGQWVKGKSCDTFGPIGPWLVTQDEIPDVQALDMWLEVDGVRYQQSNTKNMIFSVAFLISYLSQFFTLQPGSVISTGSPPGVGLGQKPSPVFLKAGQLVTLEISGLGRQMHLTVPEFNT